MTAGFRDMSWQPADDAKYADDAGDQDDQHDPYKDVEPLILAPQLAGCGSGNFHLPLRISARGRYSRTV